MCETCPRWRPLALPESYTPFLKPRFLDATGVLVRQSNGIMNANSSRYGEGSRAFGTRRPLSDPGTAKTMGE